MIQFHNERQAMLEVGRPEAVRARAIELQRMDPAVLDPAIDGIILGGSDPDELLAQSRCPLHLLAAQAEFGGAMDAQDVQRFVEHAPRCTQAVLEGAGHGIHEERPAGYLHALQQLIAAAD